MELENRNFGCHSHFDWFHRQRPQANGSLETQRRQMASFFFFCSTALGGASHHGATRKVKDWKTEPPSGLLYQRRLPTDRAILTLPTHQQFITVGEKRDGKRKDSVRRNLQHVRVLLFCLRKKVRTFKKKKNTLDLFVMMSQRRMIKCIVDSCHSPRARMHVVC